MKKLKIGICGLNRGRIHLMNALRCKDMEVKAVCDIDVERADAVAAKYCSKDVKVYYDHRDLVADPDVEAVIMATPIDVHAQTVTDALAAGKHVLSEVIVATTIDDIYRIQEAIKKSGKIYMMAENYCFIRPMVIVKDMADRGLFGEIYYAESDYLKDFQVYHPNFPNIGGWRRDTYFGRKGHPYITHSIGPLLHVMGEKVKNVICLSAGHYFDMVADSTAVLMLETEKGHLLRLRSSFVSPCPDNVTYYSFQGTNGCYQAPQGPKDFHKIYIPEFCKAGGWNNPGQWRNIYDLETCIPEEWKRYWKPEEFAGKLDNDTYALFDTGLAMMLDKFADCVLNKKTPPVKFEDAANWTAAGILSGQSVQEGGRSIEVPFFA